MDTDQLAGFFLFALAASITPGPANIAILADSANGKWRRTFTFASGILVGFSVVLISSAVLYLLSVTLTGQKMFWLKLLGSAYLLYLAYNIASASIEITNSLRSNTSSVSDLGFLKGLCIHPLSSKAWLFVFLSYSTFAFGTSGLYIFIFSAIFLLTAMISMAPWMIIGRLFGLYLPSKGLVWINYSSAIALVLLVLCLWI